MVQRIIVWIIKLSPSLKRWLWKFWYNLFARKLGFHAFRFMNYGYDEDGFCPDLLEQGEAERYSIHLYHHTATQVDVLKQNLLEIDSEEAATGWSAPKTSEWLELAIRKASLNFFEERDCSMSEGGTIPFMAMLGEEYPDAQFVITGILGPNSNAHGPNEFLHIPYAKKLTCCIASIINDFN